MIVAWRASRLRRSEAGRASKREERGWGCENDLEFICLG